MSTKSCKTAHHPRRDGTIDTFHQRATRMPRFPLMNQLSARQVAQFQNLAAIYRADLLDPAAWEALLLLLEICNILDLLPTVIDRIFGEGMRARVETWSGEIHPRGAHPPAAGELRRAWVWLPHAPRPPADTPAPVRFLPDFDNLLLSHGDRTRVIAEDHRGIVYQKGNLRLLPTFLVDGFVAGMWRSERTRNDATLTITPFSPLSPGTQRELTNEGEGLIRFIEEDAATHAVAFAEPLSNT